MALSHHLSGDIQTDLTNLGPGQFLLQPVADVLNQLLWIIVKFHQILKRTIHTQLSCCDAREELRCCGEAGYCILRVMNFCRMVLLSVSQSLLLASHCVFH